MKKVAVVYHSGHGNTERFAQEVVAGAQGCPQVDARLFNAQELTAQPDRLTEFDGIIWGSPTYLGGVSGPFKSFMDATGHMWSKQKLKGKLAAGFTVSALPSGDKQSTLQSMFVFSMQHGMIWVGNPILPEQHGGVPYEEAANRLGSWSGAMGQVSHTKEESAFVPGDLKTAKLFGQNFAKTLGRMCR